jgi:pyruvate dehydrogenase E1 component beta subunit
MATMSMIEAIRAALHHEMAADERVMVLGEDVGKQGGVFRATEGLQNEFGIERVVDTPVSEAAIIGASIGLATAGMVPVAELQFLGFAHQAFHQIGFQLGRFRYRTLGRFPLQVTIRAPYGGGVHAPELHLGRLRGDARQRTGHQDRGAVDGRRCQGPAHRRDP